MQRKKQTAAPKQLEEGPSIVMNLSLAPHIYNRLFKLSKKNGVGEQDLARLFISMGLNVADPAPTHPSL